MKNKSRYITITALALTLAITVVGEPMKMKVNADNVNLRAGADSHKEVIKQASYDDILYAAGKDESGKWYRVLPPQGTKLYVHEEFIKDNKVLVKKLNVRSGPGINYTTITAIPRGQMVNVIEKRNEWLAIAPPENSYLWISVDYLEPVIVPKPLPVKKATVASKRTPPKAVKPPPPTNRSFAGQINPGQTTTSTSYKSAKKASKIPSAIASKKLQSRPQGVYMKGYEGFLKKGSMFVSSPSRYYLMQYDPNDRVIKICYVLGNSEQLENLLGKSLVISGECYWLDGYSTAVVIPKQITKSK